MRIAHKWIHRILIVLVFLFLPLISSCLNNGEAKIRAWLDFPQQGNSFLVDDTIPITAHYYVGDEVGKVEITINGQAMIEVPSPDITVSLGDINYKWTPSQPGSYTIGVSIAAADGTPLSSEQVSVVVLDEDEIHEGTFNVNGFCRSGPGTVYNRLAVFEVGTQVTLEARSEPGIPLWWYVFDPLNDLHCWVSFSILDTDADPELMASRISPPLPDPESVDSSSGTAKCHLNLPQEKCIAIGGTWVASINALGDGYCECP